LEEFLFPWGALEKSNLQAYSVLELERVGRIFGRSLPMISKCVAYLRRTRQVSVGCRFQGSHWTLIEKTLWRTDDQFLSWWQVNALKKGLGARLHMGELKKKPEKNKKREEKKK